MKVVAPGILAFSPFGGLRLHGWVFDAQGVAPSQADLLAAALLHIAEGYGVDLGADDLSRVTPELERATLDAIAVMRWPENGSSEA